MPTSTRKNSRSHTAHACTADRLSTRKAASAESTAWELHIGHCKLFITGPAEHQWFAVSAPAYSGPVGTDWERAVAEHVITILNRDHQGDAEAGRPLIDELLKQARADLRARFLS